MLRPLGGSRRQFRIRQADGRAHRHRLIVGESLWGVAYAGIVAAAGTDAPLALAGEGFAMPALIGGTLLFVALTWLLYRRTMRLSVQP